MNKILDVVEDIKQNITDNERKIKKEKEFKATDFILNYLKQNNKFIKDEIVEAIYSQLFKKCCTEEEINEYIETRNLKKYFKKIFQNTFNLKFKCNVCNKFYTKRYMPKHQQTLQHIENTHEFNVEEDIEQQLEDYFV